MNLQSWVYSKRIEANVEPIQLQKYKIWIQAERWNWIANGLQSNVQSWADSKSIEAKVELVQLQH